MLLETNRALQTWFDGPPEPTPLAPAAERRESLSAFRLSDLVSSGLIHARVSVVFLLADELGICLNCVDSPEGAAAIRQAQLEHLCTHPNAVPGERVNCMRCPDCNAVFRQRSSSSA